MELKAIDGPSTDAVGGKYDTVERKWVGAPDEWPVWFVGEGQMPPLQSDGRFVCIGAMGAGKTEVLARAAICRAFLSPGKDIGIVAPIQKRLVIAWQKILRLLQPRWVTNVRLADREIVLVNGCRLQFIAAKMQSKAVGSPVQGFSWVACFVDEEQDIDNEAMADVLMRGRDAPGGRYPVLSTCTLKDTPSWRERKHKYEKQADVQMYRMEAYANPFVDAAYWESLRSSLTPRQFRLRVLALDAPPERAVFPDFAREKHCIPEPMVGAEDITRKVLGGCYDMLLGHDPGVLMDVTEFMRCYRMPDGTVCWWVVDEIITTGTAEVHATALTARLRLKWGLQYRDERGEGLGQAVCIADPYGESDNRPDIGCYMQFQRVGIDIFSASGVRNKPIPRDSRYQLGNRLIKDAAHRTRLYVAVDEYNHPAAPKLVEAMEMAEYDERGKFGKAKGPADVSHYPDAMLFGLWRFERERVAFDTHSTGVPI